MTVDAHIEAMPDWTSPVLNAPDARKPPNDRNGCRDLTVGVVIPGTLQPAGSGAALAKYDEALNQELKNVRDELAKHTS